MQDNGIGQKTVKQNEINSRGDSEMLHEIARDTTRKSVKHKRIRVVSRTVSCSISESTLQFISFLPVYMYTVAGKPTCIAQRAEFTNALI